ncbi:MAG: 30S ribosomal protein S17 [Thermoleophilaceae bacterium]|nr:30S ribosomal protein S17 [Thermoleophilaceae bacterium]
MSEEPENKQNEETPEDTVAEAGPEAPAEAAPEGAPAEEPPVDSPKDEAAETPPKESPAAPAQPAEPEERLSPKEIRRRTRSAHSGEARPQRSVEERITERQERRAKNAAERRRWREAQKRKRAARPATPTPALEPEEHGPGTPRERQGVVVSDKGDKTITVRIDLARRHRRYTKIVRTSSTLHAHDEKNEAGAGDTVRVIESRPMSKSKRWRLVEVVERAR